MPFIRPTLTALQAQALADLQQAMAQDTTGLYAAVLPPLANMAAGLVQGEYGYLDYQATQLLPDSATDYLPRWGNIKGVSQTAAVAAGGNVVFTGNVGTAIPVSTVVQTGGGVQYATASAAAITATGTVSVPVVAVVAGAAGNAAAGTNLTLTTAIIGVSPSAAVDLPGLTGGADQELITTFRTGLLALLANPPQGGCASDYLEWASQVPGVTRAWVFSKLRGPGTVDLAFAMDGRANPIPTATDVAAVQSYIDALKPVTADLLVWAPTPYPLNLTLTGLVPSDAATLAAITNAVSDMLVANASPGGLLQYQWIDNAVGSVTGLTSYFLSSPSANVQVPVASLAVVGTITS